MLLKEIHQKVFHICICVRFCRRSVACNTHLPTRSTAAVASPCSRWTATSARSTVRTCACWPSCSSTTRRCTTTSSPSSSTYLLSTTKRAAISWDTSQRFVQYRSEIAQLFGSRQGARCSSVVRAFAHGAMGRRIDPTWWTH